MDPTVPRSEKIKYCGIALILVLIALAIFLTVAGFFVRSTHHSVEQLETKWDRQSVRRSDTANYDFSVKKATPVRAIERDRDVYEPDYYGSEEGRKLVYRIAVGHAVLYAVPWSPNDDRHPEPNDDSSKKNFKWFGSFEYDFYSNYKSVSSIELVEMLLTSAGSYKIAKVHVLCSTSAISAPECSSGNSSNSLSFGNRYRGLAHQLELYALVPNADNSPEFEQGMTFVLNISSLNTDSHLAVELNQRWN